MRFTHLTLGGLGLAGVAMLGTPAAAQVDLVVFDANQFNANGFTFNDFGGGAVDASGGFLDIDVMTDLNGTDGLFGGMGSDVSSFFDVNNAQFEITLTPDPLNVASAFRVTLRDDDGSGTADEHVFEFDLSGLTPGVQTTITQPLSTGLLFTQGAFNFFPGDAIQNYDDAVGAGLTQIQIQSVFDSPDRLKLAIDSVKIVDPLAEPDPNIFNFTPATQSAQPSNFDFGTFQDPGAVDTTNGNFVINSTNSADPETNGGIGFNGTDIDFDAENAKLIVEAKLLPGNTASGFDIILNDLDGDDSGPGLGSDEYLFTFATSDFNETEFTTVELMLGTGSESGVRNTFGFTNGGDGIQNFDLAGMQIQSLAEDSTLAIEIVRATIMEIAAGILGDYNNSGQVEQGDLDLVLQNWGLDSTGNVPAGWTNDLPEGIIEQTELDGVLSNWGSTSAPDFRGVNVPEPAAFAVLGGLGLLARRRRVA